MKEPCDLANRESIRAFYSNGVLLILATGQASAGDAIDIDMVRGSGPPLELVLQRCPKPGVWPDVMRSYTHKESFVLTRHPERVRIAGTVRIHHQDGVDEVPLEGLPAELADLVPPPVAGGERRATGYSSNLSFDEAFADAVKTITAEQDLHPDELLKVRVEEVGGLFGGLFGFRELYVKLVAAPRQVVSRPIEEIAPERPEVIVEVAPGSRQEIRRVAEVITEVAPNRIPRPDAEVVVEVAPDRPGYERGQGPIAEVAPERPEPS